MSVMAKHMSPVPQFMSLKEKEALGWVDDGDVKTIAADGEYSLSALGTAKLSDAVGYKLDIPEKDKTLYLEYRNFAADGNKYDCQDKDLYKIDGNQVDKTKMKSGLVCCRSRFIIILLMTQSEIISRFIIRLIIYKSCLKIVGC